MIYTAIFKRSGSSKKETAVLCLGNDWWDARKDAIRQVLGASREDLLAMVPGAHNHTIVFEAPTRSVYPLDRVLTPMAAPEDR